MIRILILHTIFLACLIFCFSKVSAQIQTFTTENGLPSNGIKGMQWDEETGFLWIGTESGIVRFNGVDFRIYKKENMPEIASERMQLITRNLNNEIYIADQGGNIFKINQNKPTLWQKGDLKNNPTFNNYFLLNVSEAFYKEKNKKNSKNSISLLNDKIIPISDTATLILFRKQLLYFSISETTPNEFSLFNQKVNSVFSLQNNYFLQFENKIIKFLNIKTNETKDVEIKNTNGKSIKNGNIYWESGMPNPICIDNNIAYYLTYENNILNANYITDKIPTNNYIRSIQYSKKNKLLFIATDSKGIIVIENQNVFSKKRVNANNKNRDTYYAQIPLENGSILTNEGEIINENSAKTKIPIAGKFGFNISYTQDSLLWYYKNNAKTNLNTFYSYNTKNFKTKEYTKINTPNIVAQLNNITYMANLKGIGYLNNDTLTYLYQFQNESNNFVSAFLPISNTEIAVAYCSGFSIFNITNNTLTTYYTKEFSCVRSLWHYKDYIFFGTYGDGFYIYQNGKIKKMPLDKMGYLSYTHCFMPDDYGYCWISTNRGLFKTNIDELITAFATNEHNVYYHYLGKKDGMETTELNGGCAPCAVELKDKTISFPSMDGLLWVNPKTTHPIMPNGAVYIDEIKINDIPINIDTLINFKWAYTTKQIEIALGVGVWCNKENIYLEYQLNPTEVWQPINVDKEMILRLNNLNAGNYKLLIRKTNGFGNNNYAYKEISFTIIKAWYKRWWFYALCLLCLLLATWQFIKIRNRKFIVRQKKLEFQIEEKTKELLEKNEALEKNNSIKTRLISIISHDIVTPLKFLNVAGKNLAKNKHLMSEALQQETINEITDTSKELQLLSTNILNWIKYQNENRRVNKETFNAYEMANEVKGILKSLAAQKKLEIINNLNPQLKIHQYYEPLKILLYNLITNAIQFSENAEIIISSYNLNNYIILQVEDFGAGMTANQIENILANETIITQSNINSKKGHGLGYLIIKDLIKMTGGTLQIESKIGIRTTIKISFPLYI